MNTLSKSESYKKIFEDNLVTFSNSQKISSMYSAKKYCSFFPIEGEKYGEPGSIKILFYGQATNGWNTEFDVTTIDIVKLLETTILVSRPDEGESDPLKFINQEWSRFSKSFFWNVVYKFTNQLNRKEINDFSWTNNIAWSNLMKIAPFEGGNPNNIEFEAQLEFSKKLFDFELEFLKPDIVILLTNWEWAKYFLNEDEFVKPTDTTEWIENTSKSDRPKLIVTKRKHVGSNSMCVKELFEILDKPKFKN